MELATVTEGATTLRVPQDQAIDDTPGPGKAGTGFYNPAMAITRDLTLLAALATTPDRRPEFLDGLAAAGARGLRIANETPNWLVTLNDRSRRSTQLINTNIQHLDLTDRAVARNQDVNALLANRRWAFVEIDPYGSPVPFTNLAVRAVDDGGILALSATDTTALHGTKPKPAKRRYQATPPPRNAPGWKQAASRLLVAHIVREAARFDRAAYPLLVHHHQHCIRAYVRINDGAEAANHALNRLENRVLCPQCQTWGKTACACGNGTPSGPYETRPLQDTTFLTRLQEVQSRATLACPGEVDTLLSHCQAEAELGPFYANIDRAVEARAAGGPPARDALIGALQAAGIPASRTHYGPHTVAYDGDPVAALDVIEAHATGS